MHSAKKASPPSLPSLQPREMDRRGGEVVWTGLTLDSTPAGRHAFFFEFIFHFWSFWESPALRGGWLEWLRS